MFANWKNAEKSVWSALLFGAMPVIEYCHHAALHQELNTT